MHNINSRFRLLDRPFHYPGKCAVCGAVDKQVVDFDMSADWDQDNGAVYFCYDCIREAALLTGFITPEKKLELELEIEHLSKALAVARERVIRGIKSFLDDLSAEYLTGVDLVPSDFDDKQRIEQSEGVIEGAVGTEPMDVNLTFFEGPFSFSTTDGSKSK